MKIHEYEAKQLLKQRGIPIPRGIVVNDINAVKDAIDTIGVPAIIKAQALVAGRGKAGGIVKVSSLDEAEEVSSRLLGSDLKGVKVSSLLIEEIANINSELYIGFTIDRSAKRVTAIASSKGGVDIEELAATGSDDIVRKHIDPIIGLQPFQAKELGWSIGLEGDLLDSFASSVLILYQTFKDYDCDLIECNPLCIVNNNQLLALDSRAIIDDNSVFRHKDLSSESREELTLIESKALEHGLSYVELDGSIGIVGNGAGLVMATLDLIDHYGSRPANFLDIGGGAKSEVVEAAIDIALQNSKVKVLFINILGGITRCDEVAQGIVDSLANLNSKIPFVVRLVGTNQEEGWKILKEAGVEVKHSMEEAAEIAVSLSN